MLEKLTFRDGWVPMPGGLSFELERRSVNAEFDTYTEFDGFGNYVSFGELRHWFYTRPTLGLEDATVKIIDVNSNLIGSASAEFRETLDKLSRKNRQIVVNLSDVCCIDSVAIGALVSWANQLRKKGGDLKVYGLNANLKRIFNLVGASRLPNFIYFSQEQALADF